MPSRRSVSAALNPCGPLWSILIWRSFARPWSNTRVYVPLAFITWLRRLGTRSGRLVGPISLSQWVLIASGYTGSVVQLRRAVSRLRPQIREPFLRLETFPGEQAQVDWAQFGHVMVGRARRALSCFVMTLSYSRALYLEFFFDQTTENFFRGHVRAFQA